MKKSKVFIGTENVGYNATTISNALKGIGIYSHSYCFSKTIGKTYGVYTDYNNLLIDLTKNNIFKVNSIIIRINKFIRILTLIYSIFKYNTFIFISPYTILGKNKDVRILKFFGKKIAFLFPGCTERDPTDKLNNENDVYCSYCIDTNKKKHCYCNNIEKKRKRVQYFEKYSDYIFTRKDTTNFLTNKEDYYPLYVITKRHNEPNILEKYKNKKIRIVHFPTNELLKGTKHVKKTMPRLIKKYGNRIEYISIKTTHEDLLRILSEAHILIDQFNVAHGLLAIEALSKGVVVVAKIADWYKVERPELPIVSTEPENLEETLIELIENSNKMLEIGEKSLNYFNKYHAPDVVANFLKKIMILN